MGNVEANSQQQQIDSRAIIDGGYLYVKTEKPFYYAGDTVFGKVYIRCQIPIDAKQLEFKISGKEKVSFYYQYEEGTGDERTTHTAFSEQGAKLFNFKGTAFVFNNVLDPGDYIIPFEFKLPQNIPGSILYAPLGVHNSPKAKIRYSVQALLQTHGNKIMKYKQLLMVHEPPLAFVQGQELAQTQVLASCCFSKGTCQLRAKFGKNVFYNNEWVGADVIIDNKNGEKEVSQTEFDIYQKVHLGTSGTMAFGVFKEYAIQNKDNNVIPSHNQEPVYKQMGLDLKQVVKKFEIEQTRGPNQVKSSRSPEEIMQLSTLAPATHSNLCVNEYFMNVKTKFKTGCCIAGNSLTVPISIIPATHQSYGFEEPEGYQPIQLTYCKFDVGMDKYGTGRRRVV